MTPALVDPVPYAITASWIQLACGLMCLVWLLVVRRYLPLPRRLLILILASAGTMVALGILGLVVLQ